MGEAADGTKGILVFAGYRVHQQSMISLRPAAASASQSIDPARTSLSSVQMGEFSVVTAAADMLPQRGAYIGLT